MSKLERTAMQNFEIGVVLISDIQLTLLIITMAFLTLANQYGL